MRFRLWWTGLAIAGLFVGSACGTSKPSASPPDSPEVKRVPSTATPSVPGVGHDDGICMAGAPSWPSARAWAASFEIPLVNAEPPNVELVGGDRDLAASGYETRTLFQIARYPKAEIVMVRAFAFVERGPNDIAGCAVSERRFAGISEDDAKVDTPLRVESTVATEVPTGTVAWQVKLDGSYPFNAAADVICRIGGGTPACVAIEGKHAYRVDEGAVSYKHNDHIERFRVAFIEGKARWIDDDGEQPIAGRSSGWRAAHPGESVSAKEDVEVPKLQPKDAAAWKGKWRDHGVCISRASDWDTVELWAQEFRGEGELKAANKGEIDAGLSAKVIVGSMGGRHVAAYNQSVSVREAHLWIERHFLGVETEHGIAACLVSSDQLLHGYTQGPTAIANTLTSDGARELSYRARHEWHNASAEDEEADWQIFCTVREGELGCLSAVTSWVFQVYDAKAAVASPKRTDAIVSRRGDTVEWSEGDQKIAAKIEIGTAKIIDRGSVLSLTAKGGVE